MRGRFVLVAIVALSVAGCGSNGGSPAGTVGPSTEPTFAATIAATNAASAPSSDQAAPSGTVAVDLTFAGTYPLTAKGSAGQCLRGTSSTGAPILSFTATEADYAGLGSSFYVGEAPDGQTSVKWLVNSSLAWGGVVTGVTFSADHRTMNVDVTFPGISNPETVRGTIFCP